MVKRRFSKHVLRALGLITLGAVLFSVAPANRVVMVPIPSPAASPTPALSPEVKRRNPLRRFFSSVFHPIARVFSRPSPEGPGCRLPPIVTVKPSSSVITLCPPGTGAPTCSSSSEVTLTADALGNNDGLLFTWGVTAGRLRGEGRKVTWVLSGLPEGTYTATVETNDGTGLTSNATTTVKVAACPDCVTLESPCATVYVICPAGAASKQSTYFEAAVAGGDSTITPTYQWSLSAGKIISGHGTKKIVVDVSDLAGKSLTATVKIGGYDPGCREIMVAVCTTEVGQ